MLLEFLTGCEGSWISSTSIDDELDRRVGLGSRETSLTLVSGSSPTSGGDERRGAMLLVDELGVEDTLSLSKC